MITRRKFISSGVALAGVPLVATFALSDETGSPLPPWSHGELDIHHIDTGRGNSTFILAPDGTTVLIDCGTTNDALDVSAPNRPNASREPGEWVARYALHHARAANRDALDYLIATHIHPDHVGDIPPGAPASGKEKFIFTGVSQVDQQMPAAIAIDRSFPDYGALLPPDAPFAANYFAWLADRRRNGRRVERIAVGSEQQIKSRSPEGFPDFSIRTLAANGRVWSGAGANSRSIFPDLSKIAAADRPTENSCSIALRVNYGRFSYFTGGDLTAETRDGRLPWMDVETPTVRVCGQVEVAVADHHGYFDSCGREFTRNLNAQAYVIPAWHVTHPAPAQIERLIGAWPGERTRDVFATEMLPANRLFNSRWVNQIESTQGHVVVRVAPGGASYRIFVCDSTTEFGPVKKVCGPYTCRPGGSAQ